MRTLYVTEFISLDGVVEAPGGEESYKHTGWTFDIDEDPTMYEFKGEETFGTETLLLGRTTYEGFSAAWPQRDGDFADKFNTHGEGRRLDHAAGPDLEQHHGGPRPRRRPRPQGGRRRPDQRRTAAPPSPSRCTRPGWSTTGT